MQNGEVSKNQINRLEGMLKKNKTLQAVLERADSLGMQNWYLGAGCISQTVWNILHGFEPERNIKDYDLVYYDANDISEEGQEKFIKKAKELFEDIPAEIEIVNEARVHSWVEEEFGYAIDQYKNVKEAIGSWPTTITCVAVRPEGGVLKVCAPYGLDDVFNMVLRPKKNHYGRGV